MTKHYKQHMSGVVALLGFTISLMQPTSAAPSDCMEDSYVTAPTTSSDLERTCLNDELTTAPRFELDRLRNASVVEVWLAQQRESGVQCNARVETACDARTDEEYGGFLVRPGESTTRTKTPLAKAASRGACYSIHHERHPILCNQLLQNLNLFCEAPPMACELNLDPSMSRLFTHPKWEELDPIKEFKRVGQIFRTQMWEEIDRNAESERIAEIRRLSERGGYSRPNLNSPDLEARRQELWRENDEAAVRALAVSGKLRLSRARLNINNSGQDEWIYRLQNEECDPNDIRRQNPRYRVQLIAIYNEQTDDMVHDPGPTYVFDYPFLFGGNRTYLMKWWRGEKAEGRISVREFSNASSVCEFNYLRQGVPQ